MQSSGMAEQHAVMVRQGLVPQGHPRPAVPLLARFLGKVVLDVMPAALASVIGGFLFTQFHFGHAATPQPAAAQVTPASAEMLALVRDEHAVIVDYLKSQMAAEASRAQAEDAADRDAAAKAADARAAAVRAALDASARRIAAAEGRGAAHARTAVVAAAAAPPHGPLVIAQAGPAAAPAVASDGNGRGDRLARDPNSLLGKTLDIKDHVVAATRHVVSAIGDVFASVGERISGGAIPNGRQFSSDS